MKKTGLKYLCVFSLAMCLGAALMHVSQDVQKAEKKKRSIERLLKAEKNALKVLQAEWSYLNSPQRLEELAMAKTDLVPPHKAKAFIHSDLKSKVFLSSENPLKQNISYNSFDVLHLAASRKKPEFSSYTYEEDIRNMGDKVSSSARLNYDFYALNDAHPKTRQVISWGEWQKGQAILKIEEKAGFDLLQSSISQKVISSSLRSSDIDISSRLDVFSSSALKPDKKPIKSLHQAQGSKKPPKAPSKKQPSNKNGPNDAMLYLLEKYQ